MFFNQATTFLLSMPRLISNHAVNFRTCDILFFSILVLFFSTKSRYFFWLAANCFSTITRFVFWHAATFCLTMLRLIFHHAPSFISTLQQNLVFDHAAFYFSTAVQFRCHAPIFFLAYAIHFSAMSRFDFRSCHNWFFDLAAA